MYNFIINKLFLKTNSGKFNLLTYPDFQEVSFSELTRTYLILTMSDLVVYHVVLKNGLKWVKCVFSVGFLQNVVILNFKTVVFIIGTSLSI